MPARPPITGNATIWSTRRDSAQSRLPPETGSEAFVVFQSGRRAVRPFVAAGDELAAEHLEVELLADGRVPLDLPYAALRELVSMSSLRSR